MARGRKFVAFVGGREKGKSTQLKILHEATKHEPLCVLNMSYQGAWMHLPEITMEQWKVMKSGAYQIHDTNYKLFYKIASDKWKTGWKGKIFHEDAGESMKAQKDEDTFGVVIGLRHKHTDLVQIFHSIADTPPYVIRQLNEMILFKTGDSWSKVEDRFPDFIREEAKRIFDEVNNSPNPYAWGRIILQKTGTR